MYRKIKRFITFVSFQVLNKIKCFNCLLLLSNIFNFFSRYYTQGGQGGFEDVRRYIKQGGDFCKELASILHERYILGSSPFIFNRANTIFFRERKKMQTYVFSEPSWKLLMRRDSANSAAS